MLNLSIPLTFLTALGFMALAFLVSLGLTPLARKFAIKVGAMDIPKDTRRMHKNPTPLLGGLAISVTFILLALLFVEMDSFLRSLLIGSTLIIVTGVLDDLFDLSPLLKLCAQAAAALVVIADGTVISGFYLFGGWLELNTVFAVILTFVWIVGLTNATNLIDGLDGLSSGVCVISALSLAVICFMDPSSDSKWSLLLLLLAGSGLGFIPHNFSKKKIFMGDTGALFLGYVLACLSVQGVFKTQAVLSFVAPVTIFSLPIFDTSFAFIRRILQGSSPFKADRKHLHHRLVDMGLSPRMAVVILWGISAVVSLMAIVFYIFDVWPLFSFLAVLAVFLLLYLYVSYKGAKVAAEKPKSGSEAIARLKKKKLFLLDMDGTLYIGSQVFKATPLFLEYIRRTGGRYYFLTNNSSKSAADYVDKLKKLGIEAGEEDFITSVQATAHVLGDKYLTEKIYVLGTESFKREMRESGFHVVDTVQDDIACLVVGYDTELTYRKLEDACILLGRETVEYYATNPDWVCPTVYGSAPDCGSICEMLHRATGRKPTVIGKPERTMVDMALARSGIPAEDALIIGDRLYTDIACGVNAEIDSAFVLSGEGKIADLSGSEVRPTYTFDNIGELIRCIVS